MRLHFLIQNQLKRRKKLIIKSKKLPKFHSNYSPLHVPNGVHILVFSHFQNANVIVQVYLRPKLDQEHHLKFKVKVTKLRPKRKIEFTDSFLLNVYKHICISARTSHSLNIFTSKICYNSISISNSRDNIIIKFTPL